MKSRVHLCSKGPLSTNQDIFNEMFGDSSMTFIRIFQSFLVLIDILLYLMKLSKILQNCEL
jgi:hypothetical protein